MVEDDDDERVRQQRLGVAGQEVAGGSDSCYSCVVMSGIRRDQYHVIYWISVVQVTGKKDFTWSGG